MRLFQRGELAHADRVFGLVLLDDIESGKKILVVSTHLERNPEDEKLETTRFAQLVQIQNAMRQLNGKYDAVVWAGDMNADFKEERWTAARSFISSRLTMLRDAFDFDSLDEQKQLRYQDFCTSRTEVRKVMIDYIFYSPHSLSLLRASGPDLCPDSAIPDELHPSDHIPVIAKFAWGSERHSWSDRSPNRMSEAQRRWHNVKRGIHFGIHQSPRFQGGVQETALLQGGYQGGPQAGSDTSPDTLD